MGRRYILSGENMTLGTGNVLTALQSAAAGNAGSIIKIERVEVSQNHNTTSAQIRLEHGQRNTSGTLTVTSATPNPIVLGGPASGISGGTNALSAATCGINSSADSGGTYTNLHQVNPNNLGGWAWQCVPDKQEIVLAPSTLWVVRQLATPGDTAGWTISIWFEEYF